MLGLDTSHNPTAQETSYHEEGQRYGEDNGREVVAHPTLARDIIDEIAIDGYLCNLIGQQGEQSENEHGMVLKQLLDARALLTVLLGLGMFDLGKVDTREYNGNDQHQNAKDGVRQHNVVGLAIATEEKLTDEECG